MFDADRPIQTKAQDLLGRSTFAKYLARCILDHTNLESLVIGLYGSWGVGKTSLINLTLEELHSAAANMFDDEKPVILNFSPWSYSGQNQLIYSFFRRLSSEIRRSELLKDKEEIIYRLELYVSFFTRQPIPKPLRPNHHFLTRIFRPKLMTQETYGWESGRDLTQVKLELNELLRNQKYKIIIIIDNISRLDNPEIKQIFQIVKSMGDYANTIYVLAMDKQSVIHAIDTLQGTGGAEYLEKVIQLPFEIPSISQQDIEIMLIDRLKKVIEVVPEDAWNKDYWADLYYSTLKYFFKNVRDITHYVNTLSFSYVHVKEVVNPVDFFAMTALEVFAPGVYYGIRENKDLFTDLMDEVYTLDSRNMAEDKSRCDEILNRSQKIPKEYIIQLLIRLFPRLRAFYETDIPFYHSDAVARQNFRICAPDIFEVYFRLSMPTGVLPEVELEAILAMVNDKEGFAFALLRLNKDDKILKFLSWLDSKGVVKIPTQYLPNVIYALLDGADAFPVGEDNAVSFDTLNRIHRIIHQLTVRFSNREHSFEAFRDAIKQSVNSIYSLVHELILQGEEHIETSDTFIPVEHRDLTPIQLQTLQKLVVAKIVSWAETNRLVDHVKLIPILTAWKTWGEEADCKRYVTQITQDDKGLLAFLCAALKEPVDQAITKQEKNSHWSDYLVNIEYFISTKSIEPHAILMFESDEFEKLREREQLAILIFLDLINAKTTKIIPKTTV